MLVSMRTIKAGAPSIQAWVFKEGVRYVLGESCNFEASVAEIANWIGLLNGAEGIANKDIVFTVHNVSAKDFDITGDNSHDDSTGWTTMAAYAAFYAIFVPVAPVNYLVGGRAIQGPFHIWPGGQQWRMAAKTAGEAKEREHWNMVDATSGAVAMTLAPTSVYGDGKEFVFVKVDSSGNAVTITPDAADTGGIEGAGSVTLSAQWDKVRLLAYHGKLAWVKG